jgi:hypothetical protein
MSAAAGGEFSRTNADGGRAATVDRTFAAGWRAEILAARPPIAPARQFVYPRVAEEVERGALEVMIWPGLPETQPFLATCALGFRDPAVPFGLWSTPEPEILCAVAGGYAYLIDTARPERFEMVSYRPVLAVYAVDGVRIAPELPPGLLLFVGHRSVVAYGARGRAWETEKLSDEGVTVTAIEGDLLRGLGWQMRSDQETEFAVDLRTGARV